MAHTRKQKVLSERAERLKDRKLKKSVAISSRHADLKNGGLKPPNSKLNSTRQLLATKQAVAVDDAHELDGDPVSGCTGSSGTGLGDTESPCLEASISDHMTAYVDEYLKAEVEIENAKKRLVALRGSETNLTEDDKDALENLRDMLSSYQSKFLEV